MRGSNFILKHLLLFLLSLRITLEDHTSRYSYQWVRIQRLLLFAFFLSYGGYCKIATATAMSVDRRKKAVVRAVFTRNLQSLDRIRNLDRTFWNRPRRGGDEHRRTLPTNTCIPFYFGKFCESWKSVSTEVTSVIYLIADSIMLSRLHGLYWLFEWMWKKSSPIQNMWFWNLFKVRLNSSCKILLEARCMDGNAGHDAK